MERTRAVVEDILSEAKKKGQEIVERAKKEADTLLQSAEISGKEAAEIRIKEAKQEAQQLYRERLMRKRLEIRKRVLNKREELLNSLLEEVKNELAKFTGSKQYQKWFEEEIEVVTRELGKELIIDVREEDLNLLQKVSSKLKGVEISQGSTIRCLGGFVARTKDGKQLMDCTFETRIAREWENLRARVAQILFAP